MDSPFSLIMPLIPAVITTVFGGLIVFFWQRAQKRKELAVETLAQFQRLYGEFFALYHLWDAFKQHGIVGINANDFTKDIIQRAYSIEGNMEACSYENCSREEIVL
jgi:hypothetical protein